MFSSVYFRQEKEEGSQSPLKMKAAFGFGHKRGREGRD